MLPLGEVSSTDICLISAMCTSVSFCNGDRRSLHCCDPSDPKQASGATTHSALKYVEQKKLKDVVQRQDSHTIVVRRVRKAWSSNYDSTSSSWSSDWSSDWSCHRCCQLFT